MINILIPIAVLLTFLCYDISLRIGLVVHRGRSNELAERFERKALRRIFSLLRVHRGFVLELENILGEELPPRFLFVSNQQSLLDIPVTMALLESRKLRFVAKKELGGGVPLVFPEGTRTRDGEVGQFHTAGIRRIMDLDSLPMLVALIEGGCRLAKLHDVSKNLKGATYRVRLVALLPHPHGKKEVLGSIERARQIIVSELAAMRSEKTQGPPRGGPL
jgi:1-acyl-sn-glycerol-3-phosphate acyltransferase